MGQQPREGGGEKRRREAARRGPPVGTAINLGRVQGASAMAGVGGFARGREGHGRWWLAEEPRHGGAVPLPVITGLYSMEKGGRGREKENSGGKFTTGEVQTVAEFVQWWQVAVRNVERALSGGIRGAKARRRGSSSELAERVRAARVGALRRGE
jgi:hypothetical protein